MTLKTSIRDWKPLAPMLYLAAFMLFIIPLIEVAGQLGFTVRLDTLQWRTGAVGMLASSILTPTFGLIIAIAAAYLLEHDRTLRILAWLAGAGALLLVGVLAAFVLDGWQLRGSLNPQMKRPFTIAMVKAIVNIGIVFVVLAGTCFAGLRATRRVEPSRKSQRGDLPVVGRA